MSKKEKIILGVLGGVFVLCLLFAFGYRSFQNEKLKREEQILEIKKHYGNFVQTNQECAIYTFENENYTQVGKVSADIYFELEEKDIQKVSDTYFKLKEDELYLYYEDVKPIDEIHYDLVPEYYLSVSSLKTDELTKFYQDGNVVMELNKKMSFPILYSHEDYSVIRYQKHLFDVKTADVNVEDSDESVEEATFVSVLKFQEVKESCNNDSCISLEQFKKTLKILQEKQMYTISKKDYELWNQKNVHLKKGAFLLNSVSNSEEVLNALKEYGYFNLSLDDWKLNSNNKTSSVGTDYSSINSYSVSQNTTEAQLSKMINGEDVVISKPKPKTSVAKPKSLPSVDAKATNIAVLNYHFFYDKNKENWCNDGNCMEVSQFREQLDFLKNNQYKTLTMEEYRAWMYNEIELPARSVLITVDDGAMGTGKHNGNKLIPILEEYQMHATLFLITGWWDKSNYESEYLDIESHTYDMHKERMCKDQPRGAQMLCSSKEQVLNDLKSSISVTGSNKAFCFPFYAYNDITLASVKEAGFQLAFIGGYMKSTRSNDKYKIPRYPIHRNTSLSQFISYIS